MVSSARIEFGRRVELLRKQRYGRFRNCRSSRLSPKVQDMTVYGGIDNGGG
jgi:hypothetical protein